MTAAQRTPGVMDPRIGLLVRNGRQVFYAHCDVGTYHERPTLEEMRDVLVRLDAGESPLWVMASAPLRPCAALAQAEGSKA